MAQCFAMLISRSGMHRPLSSSKKSALDGFEEKQTNKLNSGRVELGRLFLRVVAVLGALENWTSFPSTRSGGGCGEGNSSLAAWPKTICAFEPALVQFDAILRKMVISFCLSPSAAIFDCTYILLL